MAVHSPQNGFETNLSKLLTGIPPLARLTRNRGVPFVISWAHRLSGLLMVVFIGFHIYTLSALTSPAVYADKMKLYQLPVLAFIEWALSIPVLFHALNGGRLILYESFRCRRDDVLLDWMAGLTLLYAGLLALLMLLGNQNVSAVFFWLIAVSVAATAVYALYVRIGRTAHVWSWKLQRITGAFLLVMIPSHFLFMHLGPQMARDAGLVALRMQNPWIKLVDAALVLSAVYHGAYGLNSILNDYVGSKELRWVGCGAIIFVMTIAALAGLRLIVSI
jgi:succinate dehydrogenase / fumarate reductase membrane anchor subunit